MTAMMNKRSNRFPPPTEQLVFVNCTGEPGVTTLCKKAELTDANIGQNETNSQKTGQHRGAGLKSRAELGT